MSKFEKLIFSLLSGNSDNNFSINDLHNILLNLDFFVREGKGSHTIYKKDGVPELINLQSTKDGKAKPYQVKQVRNIIVKFKLL
jgi:predicted RNA binding protein YcfA (HicA-like mRNA interferase family)